MSRRRWTYADHYDVDGVLVGSSAVEPVEGLSPECRDVRYAHDILAECAAVVAYIGEAEARRGYVESAEHYARLWEKAGYALPTLRRIADGSSRLPLSSVDELRVAASRLADRVEHLAEFVYRVESGGVGQ